SLRRAARSGRRRAISPWRAYGQPHLGRGGAGDWDASFFGFLVDRRGGGVSVGGAGYGAGIRGSEGRAW
ncbi:MAG: hypothetical protein ACRDQA_30225, partial [Nocardioidaceae bacterium]